MKAFRAALAVVALTALVFPAPAGLGAQSRAGLPARLTDAEFWRLSQEFSEADGYFPSDNLVSNEDTFQVVIPTLVSTVKPGGVYVGVGPDQNFTFIAAVRPAIAFIPDVRRGNLLMHLLYKSLMELSPDRAAFVSRLFARPRPPGLSATTSVDALFDAFATVSPTQELFDETTAAIHARLAERGLVLGAVDLVGVGDLFRRFVAAGPQLTYSSSPAGRVRYPAFEDLQRATDAAGVARAYLASEDHYRRVRTMQMNNLIVPVVGNLAGPKALRAIGDWVRQRSARVTTFYASNVEHYLFQDRIWAAFADNLATLPADETSTVIRSCFNFCINASSTSRVVMLLDSLPALVRDHKAGLILGYGDVLARQR